MTLNVTKELAALERMTPKQLRAKYEEVFEEECRSNHKQWLVKRIIWRMQANAEGDLSERARRRAEELANDADLRLKAPTEKRLSGTGQTVCRPISQNSDCRIPLPGAVLKREYKGQILQVTVKRDGFEYEGVTYKSLSAVAKAITGSHTSGFLFFGLNGKRGEK